MEPIKSLSDLELFALELFNKIGDQIPKNLTFKVTLNREDFEEMLKRCFAENDYKLFFSHNLEMKRTYRERIDCKQMTIEANGFNFLVIKQD